jgi:pyruvate kinase
VPQPVGTPKPERPRLRNGARELRRALLSLRRELLDAEERAAEAIARVPTQQRASARNLVHYLELRHHDLRGLQVQLAERGLSSLGRNEAHSLATIEAVLALLEGDSAVRAGAPIGFRESRRLLERRSEALLGPEPAGRKPRIMVTAPSEAATDPGLVERMLEAGMDCLRINAAHDGVEAWEAMVENLRRATARLGRRCRVELDIAGPKLRTGSLPPGPAVVKLRPHRDGLGLVVSPARVWLTAAERPLPSPEPADGTLPVPEDWLARRRASGRLVMRDARGRRRLLDLGQREEGGRWATLERTAYVLEGTILTPDDDAGDAGSVGPLRRRSASIRLKVGETLRLTLDDRAADPPRRAIPCTLPEVFDAARECEPIWFDDGRLGGIVEAVSAEEIVVRVTEAGRKGARLRADKGINLPDTDLHVPAITRADLEVIAFAARHADIVGLSFVSSPDDLRKARELLREHGGDRVGIVLKVETKRAFAALPELLLAALEDAAPSGVMIARGDLAVECGYERLAEVQEEILWLAEAAHVPVIWATQVLEGLAKTGRPSRAEITDAAMGVRAECVMLNKGPRIVEAVQTLDDILRRMSAHQDKKQSLLRELRSFAGARSPT